MKGVPGHEVFGRTCQADCKSQEEITLVEEFKPPAEANLTKELQLAESSSGSGSGSVEEETTNDSLILGIIIGSSSLGCILFAIALFFVMRKSRRYQEVKKAPFTTEESMHKTSQVELTDYANDVKYDGSDYANDGKYDAQSSSSKLSDIKSQRNDSHRSESDSSDKTRSRNQ